MDSTETEQKPSLASLAAAAVATIPIPSPPAPSSSTQSIPPVPTSFVHLVAAAQVAAQQQTQSTMQTSQITYQHNPYSTVSTPGVVRPLEISALAHLHQTNGFPPAITAIKDDKNAIDIVKDPKGNATRKRKATLNKRKVSHACVYCRRSHMTCDDGRPCQRCIKRKIAHLCHDDHKSSGGRSNRRRSEPASTVTTLQKTVTNVNTNSESTSSSPESTTSASTQARTQPPPLPMSLPTLPTTTMDMLDPALNEDLVGLPSNTDLTANVVSTLATLDPVTMAPSSSSAFALDNNFSFSTMSAFPPLFASESMGHEFAILSDFLASWDGSFDASLDTSLVGDVTDLTATSDLSGYSTPISLAAATPSSSSESLLNGTKLSSTERFILTAADPKDGSFEDRLRQVISAKIEAGLLKPYNYINGYTQLQKWMDTHMSTASRQRILNVMGTFRPMFRSIAQSLTDYDLVMVEEAFERLLLEYDRVFSAMGIPACLWRRTGEIWKSNKEFARLVGVPIEKLKDGKTCIYELMNEESAVNYWEKYGNIAFDAGQKAVLTSCVLRAPDEEGATENSNGEGGSKKKEVQCCFSFTIRRDKYNIPLLIAGNFLIAS